ncbi:tetratricopeptide repeat protein [Pacificimonas sp. ICDLI1SI03]|jgi:tetratricopeptide (TPR) repeat protein|tara:strand:- start:76655 stop:78025 length:1371 start_codon:yes stop_codon:yes gene_type:complete
MKFVSRFALGAALAMGGLSATVLPATAVAAQEEAEAYSPDFSRKFVKPISEAQEAIQAGDMATATQKLTEAEGVAEKPDDLYYLNQFRFNIADQTGDAALRETAIKGMLDSNSEAMSATARSSLYQELGRLALERGDQAAATQYFEQLLAADPENPTAVFNVAVMQLQAGDEVGAMPRFQRAIELQEATGEPADPAWYRQVLKIAYDNQQDIMQPSLSLVRAHPTESHWRDTLVLFRDGAETTDQSDLDVFRLMHDTGALQPEGEVNGQRTRSDYIDYADTANSAAYVGEANAIMEEAKAAGDPGASTSFAQDVNSVIQDRLGRDRSELSGLADEAEGEATGRLALSTATAYLGYGENEEAARLYRLAMEKGGIDEAEANTRLGIALTRQGDLAGAREAFAKVTGGTQGGIARFWEAHVDNLESPAAAAPTPAAAPAAAPTPAPAPAPANPDSSGS